MTVQPQELASARGTGLLVYGLPGSGKTRFACSSTYKTLVVRPPTDHTESVPLPAPHVSEIEVENWQDMWDVFQWGQQGGFKPYTWVWLDSISLFQEFGLDDVFAAAIKRKEERLEFGPDKGEYGVNMIRLGKWIRDMVGLSKTGMFSLGLTAHVMEWNNPVLDEEMWAPLVQGKNMSPKVCGYMNVVAYMQATHEDGEPRREMLLVDQDGFVGKDQYNCFPALKSGRHGFTKPTLTDLESAIAKARKARKPARRRRK